MDTVDVSGRRTRLPGFRTLVRIVAISVGLFYGLFIFFLRDSLPSLRYPHFVIWALLAAALYTICITLLEKHLQWKKVFYISNFGWMVAYVSMVYGTGGANSPFLFLLAIPLVTSAWNLDPVVTKRVGIVMFCAAVLIIFADPAYLQSPGFLADFFIRLSALGIVMYYIYRLLKETLLQKYEKEEINRKFDELVEFDRMKSDFVNIVSHRLRTPLTDARWGLEAATEDEGVPPTTKYLLDQTKERVVSAIEIVNQMIFSLHSDSDIAQKVRENVRVDLLLQNIVANMQHFISGSHVSFSFGQLLPCSTIGDKDALAAVFSNLIDNAVRYSPKGKVIVHMSCDETKVFVTLSDTGIGIPKGDQEYVFQRFFRSKNAMLVQPNASGLGLYISKKILEQHKGDISFTSELDKGTQMVVTLPRAATTTV